MCSYIVRYGMYDMMYDIIICCFVDCIVLYDVFFIVVVCYRAQALFERMVHCKVMVVIAVQMERYGYGIK